MKTLATARAEASTSRQEFKQTLADIRTRLSVQEFIEDALWAFDPELGFLRWAQARINRHPLIAVALVLSAGLAGEVIAHGNRRYPEDEKTLSKGELS